MRKEASEESYCEGYRCKRKQEMVNNTDGSDESEDSDGEEAK